MTDAPSDLQRAVEAAVFASDTPLTVADIATYVGDTGDNIKVGIKSALDAISQRHAGQGIELVERGGRWHFQTAADLAHMLRRERDQARKLTRAGMEVLAIVAYHEPVSRAEIESIRGVQTAKGTLDVLMEAGWIRPAGRRDVPGRPIIYRTTSEFLTHFGLESRRDLPGIDDLKAAGLLDPVDDALEEAMAGEEIEPSELVKDGESE